METLNGKLKAQLRLLELTQKKTESLLVPVSQRFGHPRVLGIPIPISLAFWASPVGDAQNADPASTLPKLFQTGEKSGLLITNLRLNSVDAC